MTTIAHIMRNDSGSLHVHLHGDQNEADECRNNCVKCGYKVSDDVITSVKMTPARIELLDELFGALSRMNK